MAGFLHRFAPRAGGRIFVALKLAARQHPGIILAALDNGNPRLSAAAHHDASRRVNGLARHVCSAHNPPHLM
jgi:hypothetical protein